MRILLAGILAILCSCASDGDRAAQLCELEIFILHVPHHIQSTQRVQGDTSHFMCTLYTDNKTPSDVDRRELLEPACRRFIQDAMSAAAACGGVSFNPRYRDVELSPVEGADVNGPFFALTGSARRVAP